MTSMVASRPPYAPCAFHLSGVSRVTVKYSTPMDDPEARRLCTSRGNNVTVVFEDAVLPPFDKDATAASSSCAATGDLPEMEVSAEAPRHTHNHNRVNLGFTSCGQHCPLSCVLLVLAWRQFDPYNAPQNSVTGLAEGDGTFLHLKYNELFDNFLQHGRPLPVMPLSSPRLNVSRASSHNALAPARPTWTAWC